MQAIEHALGCSRTTAPFAPAFVFGIRASVDYAARFNSSCLLGVSLGRRLFPIAFVEPINAPGGIDQLLLAGEKWMASRTDFHVQVAFFC